MAGLNRRSLYLAILVILVVLLSGCATTGLPSPTSLELINSGKQSLVLIRITGDIDGKPHKIFEQAGIMVLLLGSFETGGEMQWRVPDYLSSQTRNDGWLYLMLEPGLYYLTPHPPSRYSYYEKLWRLDIPPLTGIVYAGTLHFPNLKQESVLFPGFLTKALFGEIVIRDEENAARKIAAEFLPELKTFKTMLMVRHKGPIILKTPN